MKKWFQKGMLGHAKGFTTIELIIVIVITGIMAAVVLPKLGVVGAVGLYSTARQVKSDIRYTQELAMSKYRKTTIKFDSNANTYSIYFPPSGPRELDEPKKLPPRSNAIFDSGSTLTFTFNSSGEPILGGGLILKINSGVSGVSFERIMVEGITGRATIQ